MRSFNFLYGTVEFRAKFGGGTGSGAWPVVWMADVSCQASDPNGTDDRCNGQEIDIAEILHGDFAHVNQEIHVDNFTHNDGCTASASDTSENFHVYQLTWSPGSLVFRIDGTTTCVIQQPYVPKAPMYVKVSVFAGEMGGPIKNKTLPWETLIDYVRVTQGGTVVFDDEFKEGSTIQPGPTGRFSGLSVLYWIPRLASRRRLAWAASALAACLLLAGAVITFRSRGA
jgi:beta-glucanase (GH16 family)